MAPIVADAPRIIKIECCQDCVFHKGTYPDHHPWADGEPTCVCTNPLVTKPSGSHLSGDHPVTCRSMQGNCKKTFSGVFPKWCPLSGTNVCHDGFYGHDSVAPAGIWQTEGKGVP